MTLVFLLWHKTYDVNFTTRTTSQGTAFCSVALVHEVVQQVWSVFILTMQSIQPNLSQGLSFHHPSFTNIFEIWCVFHTDGAPPSRH